MLTLPLRLNLFWGGREQINTTGSKLLEILCQLQLFNFRLLQFLRAKKFSVLFHFCACFRAWVGDHVIAFYDRVSRFALPRF